MKYTWHEQELDYSCGPASIRMALAVFGIKKSEQSINRLSKLTKEGLFHIQMITTIRRLGLYCFVKRDTSIRDLKSLLSLGLPIIVNYNMIPRRFPDSGEGGHYVLIKEIKGGKVSICCPVEGPCHIISLKEFHHNWFDWEEASQRWLMMVSKERILTKVKGARYNPLHHKH